mmetsp:Transcript_5293/g.12659  ORF Transcript_5293/g.12659 Transcript_5293/m.12659 type:complete len:150 (-) Transcript_5293:328-777(-)|eukprot:CAMPEP_0206474070 /NCGR_PEP_ID=MMETSP0324_2-20121206/33256_1 /ASSEMBLY_ACC=CAM_ASM_000836 /TAXON_ID=2866 /ORGANISM="Crypthecodinium cohnii, Strain Seligo" /LENGTH=149 /DNA_ID=CAMNT_0053949149 /DNA_START=104 /DNA_END=553 /DNA_ORIENTATION=+
MCLNAPRIVASTATNKQSVRQLVDYFETQCVLNGYTCDQADTSSMSMDKESTTCTEEEEADSSPRSSDSQEASEEEISETTEVVVEAPEVETKIKMQPLPTEGDTDSVMCMYDTVPTSTSGSKASGLFWSGAALAGVALFLKSSSSRSA